MDDLIKRADAMAYIERVINSGLGRNKSLDYIHKYISALPSAETHEIRTETHGVCLDLISREDAVGAVQDHFNAEGFKGYDDGQKMMDRINALPSADAVHGEWVIRENGNKECSVCGHERQDGWDYFCGYCGARMKAR